MQYEVFQATVPLQINFLLKEFTDMINKQWSYFRKQYTLQINFLIKQIKLAGRNF